MSRRLGMLALAAAGVVLLGLIVAGRGDRPAERTALPPALDGVGIDQRLNEPVPTDLTFKDEAGRTVRLGDYFGTKPVVLVLAYYKCPMLCNMVLNGLTNGLRNLTYEVGNQYDVITVSFDPRETPDLAAAKQKNYAEWYGRPGALKGWHFLTGDQENIDRLTRAVGFRYKWDEEKQQYAHASGVMVLTPRGTLFRYFYGVDFSSRDLYWALVEASAGKLGSPVDPIVLFCYGYDPMTGQYSLAVMRLVRWGGGVSAAALGLGLGWMWWRERRRRSLVPTLCVGTPA